MKLGLRPNAMLIENYVRCSICLRNEAQSLNIFLRRLPCRPPFYLDDHDDEEVTTFKPLNPWLRHIATYCYNVDNTHRFSARRAAKRDELPAFGHLAAYSAEYRFSRLARDVRFFVWF